MNSWNGIGRITKDLFLKKTQTGISVISFNLAVNRPFKKDGEQSTDFINCVAWNKTADAVDKYTHKGSLVGVEGRIQTRNYDGPDGKRVFVTEVVAESVQFLDTKKSNESAYASDTSTTNNNYDAGDSILDISSDDLPF